MQIGKTNLTYSHYDRNIAGSAVPIELLELEGIAPLKTGFFLDRRELGKMLEEMVLLQ